MHNDADICLLQADVLPFEEIAGPTPAPTATDAESKDDARIRALDRTLRERARLIAAAENALAGQWEEFIPELYEMHELLAQRAANYVAGQEPRPKTWSEWLDDFLADTGLSASHRTVRRKLAEYRDQLYGPDPRKTDRVSKSKPDPEDLTFGDPEATAYGGSAVASASALKPGDRSGLLNLMLRQCAHAMGNVLHGLTPGMKMEILEYVITQLIQSVCFPSRDGGRYEIAMHYVAPETEDLRRKRLSRNTGPSVEDRIA